MADDVRGSGSVESIPRYGTADSSEMDSELMGPPGDGTGRRDALFSVVSQHPVGTESALCIGETSVTFLPLNDALRTPVHEGIDEALTLLRN